MTKEDRYSKGLSIHLYPVVVEAAVQPTMEITPEKKPPTKQRRVVVTGMGAETPLGIDSDVFYNNLVVGVTGISEIEAFDCSQFPTVEAFDCSQFPTVCHAFEVLFIIQG